MSDARRTVELLGRARKLREEIHFGERLEVTQTVRADVLIHDLVVEIERLLAVEGGLRAMLGR